MRKISSLKVSHLEKRITECEKQIKDMKYLKKEIEKVLEYKPQNKHEEIALAYIKYQNITIVSEVIREIDIKNERGVRFSHHEIQSLLRGELKEAKLRPNIIRLSKVISNFNAHCSKNGQNVKKGDFKEVIKQLKGGK